MGSGSSVRLRSSRSCAPGASRKGSRRSSGRWSRAPSVFGSAGLDQMEPLRNLSIGMRQRVHEISVAAPPRARVFGSERHDKNAETEDRERGGSHANSRISASACSSQNRMSISRYIVVAVVRCSRACSPLARAPVERAEAEVAVGDERAQAQLLGQGQGLAIVRLRGIDLDAVGMGRDVAEQSQDAGPPPPVPPAAEPPRARPGRSGWRPPAARRGGTPRRAPRRGRPTTTTSRSARRGHGRRPPSGRPPRRGGRSRGTPRPAPRRSRGAARAPLSSGRDRGRAPAGPRRRRSRPDRA